MSAVANYKLEINTVENLVSGLVDLHGPLYVAMSITMRCQYATTYAH